MFLSLFGSTQCQFNRFAYWKHAQAFYPLDLGPILPTALLIRRQRHWRCVPVAPLKDFSSCQGAILWGRAAFVLGEGCSVRGFVLQGRHGRRNSTISFPEPRGSITAVPVGKAAAAAARPISAGEFAAKNMKVRRSAMVSVIIAKGNLHCANAGHPNMVQLHVPPCGCVMASRL